MAIKEVGSLFQLREYLFFKTGCFVRKVHYVCFMKGDKVKINESRGLRLKGDMWFQFDKLAEKDRRTTSQFIYLVLENYLLKKKAKES